jgi:hypothetical protein
MATAAATLAWVPGATAALAWIAMAIATLACVAGATATLEYMATATRAMVCMPSAMARTATLCMPAAPLAMLWLDGEVNIRGLLIKPGGRFKIDHPLDPANKYLSHCFVESPDMKNVYDGTVVLDDKGEAEVELPDWFGALNQDFRYQLTAIGAPRPNLYIAEEISDGVTNYSNGSSNQNNNNNNSSNFKIAGGTSGMKVSWQVTGIRKDPWANANRIQVEEDKPVKEQGYYMYPDLYGQPEEKGVNRLLFPEEEKWQEQLVNEKAQ